MASEIIMRTLDKENDTFEMLVPPRNQINSNTVITGNPCSFKYGTLALLEHSVKVDFVHNTTWITITITVAQDKKKSKGIDPPIIFDYYDVNFFFNGIYEGVIRQELQHNLTSTNSDFFGNTKYIYTWTSKFKLLDRPLYNTLSLQFVFNVKLNSEKELEQNKLKIDMTEFLMENFLSDFEIFCENETLKAHKIILANRSPMLRAMLESDMKETQEGRLVIDRIKLEVLKELLRFMYTGNVDFKPDHLLDLFKAADEYLMTDLKEKCIELIIKEICLENALDIYDAAVTHDCKPLQDVAVKFLTLNKGLIADGPEKLTELLRRFPDLYKVYAA